MSCRAAQDRGLDVVRAFLDPHAVAVDVMECVWRPAVDLLGDRSVFDAAVITVREDGSRHLVGIDVKYTEHVQPDHLQQRRLPAGARVQRLVPPRYGAAAARPGDQPAVAHQPARGRLRPARVMGVSSASVVVMCLGEDPDATRALAGLSAALREPQEHCRIVSLESFVSGVRDGLGPQEGWGDAFAERYLQPPEIHAELPDEDSASLEL